MPSGHVASRRTFDTSIPSLSLSLPLTFSLPLPLPLRLSLSLSHSLSISLSLSLSPSLHPSPSPSPPLSLSPPSLRRPGSNKLIPPLSRSLSRFQLPPGKVGITGIRETLEYLADPRAFIKKRVAMYGPVFKIGPHRNCSKRPSTYCGPSVLDCMIL